TLLGLVLGMASALAAAAPQISLMITAEKEIVGIDEQGQQVTRKVPATDTIPGDVLFYTIRYSNNGDEQARNAQLDNPIPAGTAFNADSAWGDGADILFSIDGGNSFRKPVN